MAVDRFSPIAPAYVRVLILPVGVIERSRFATFVQRLQNEAAVVSLKDLIPHVQESFFLPSAFPQGSLLFNYTTSVPSEEHRHLSPFELFREPLLVLGIRDALDHGEEINEDELRIAAGHLKERHPRVVHRQVLVLHDADMTPRTNSDEVIHIHADGEDFEASTLYKAAVQFSARFLNELGTYSRAMQATPGVQTPGHTARSLQRTHHPKELEKRPPSRHGTPQASSVPSSPVKHVDESRSKSPPLNAGSPPTSFDQITNGNGSSANGRPTRPDSRASNHARNSSQEQVSMQGFGSTTSQEKLKTRGRARVGILMGSLYMLAGQWGEALRVLVEHTSKARVLSDQIWYAKGLESIVVCMLLHAWAGLDFQIPSICYPMGEGMNVHRFSVNIPSDFRVSSEGQPATMTKLSSALPELLRYICHLYSSGEGSLELPFVVISDATIRFCKLMVVLHSTNGALPREALDGVVKARPADLDVLGTASEPSTPPSSPFKTTMTEMLLKIYPLSEEGLSIPDQTAIISGIASVYASLGMYRKETMMVKDLMTKLTHALIQARKKGAAEMGIHPAASLPIDGAGSLPSTSNDDSGLGRLASLIAAAYGVSLPSTSAQAAKDSRNYGNNILKLDFMKTLAAFCEAVPDPHAVLRVNATTLRAFGPGMAVDGDPSKMTTLLSKDDQVRCVAAINRTLGVSKLLGLPELQADYWDDFLVREVEFLPAEPGQAITDLSILRAHGGPSADLSTNPLLYDPNARPSSSESADSSPAILVQNETCICRITLQNPYDIPVEVESLRLVTDGIELKESHRPFTLKPLGIQRVSLSISPSSAGQGKVTGCVAKLQGCREREFAIVSRPWAPTMSTVLKDKSASGAPMEDEPQRREVAIMVIGPQPTLVLDAHPFQESSLMLLDGEVCELHLTIKNISKIPGAIFNVSTTNDAIQVSEIVLEEDASDASDEADVTIVNPEETVSFTFDVIGKPSVTKVDVLFSYCLNSDSMQYGRIITVPVTMTVNAALQVQRLDALPFDIAQNNEDSFVVAFDVGNAWPKSLFYSCFCTDLKLKSAEPRRCHNHEGVLAPGQVQRVFMPVARSPTLTPPDTEPETVRTRLLERLRILWELEDEERKGWVDLSSLAMSDQVREVVIGSAISLTLELLDNGNDDDMTDTQARVGTFVTLRARMHNRSTRSSPLIVQLIPHALNSVDPAQLERRLTIAGAQLRFVPPIAEGTEGKADFVLCPLLVGIMELEVVVKAALPKKEQGSHWISHKKLQLNVVA